MWMYSVTMASGGSLSFRGERHCDFRWYITFADTSTLSICGVHAGFASVNWLSFEKSFLLVSVVFILSLLDFINEQEASEREKIRVDLASKNINSLFRTVDQSK